jgi:carbamoyltransferase
MQMVVNCTDKNLPAIIHNDGTSRIQTISKDEPTIFRLILEEWKKRTGCSVLLNTSLNIRGEPMVNTISDADRFEEKYGVKVFY